jgi:hypothetical protein
MQEYDELARLRSEIELSKNVDERLQEVKEALQRMAEGKTSKIVIYRKGPIQES